MADGVVIVDKPAGWTSHDVVARVRRLAGTRRVGHAGTLDPMATGVLVVGVGKATRLLGYLALTEKVYEATIRLGQSTTTDDAEGEPAGGSPATAVSRAVLDAEIAKLTGEILQVPSSISAIKVNGQRAYKLTRAGEAPELAARPVTIHEFLVTASRREGDFLRHRMLEDVGQVRRFGLDQRQVEARQGIHVIGQRGLIRLDGMDGLQRPEGEDASDHARHF